MSNGNSQLNFSVPVYKGLTVDNLQVIIFSTDITDLSINAHGLHLWVKIHEILHRGFLCNVGKKEFFKIQLLNVFFNPFLKAMNCGFQ